MNLLAADAARSLTLQPYLSNPTHFIMGGIRSRLEQ